MINQKDQDYLVNTISTFIEQISLQVVNLPQLVQEIQESVNDPVYTTQHLNKQGIKITNEYKRIKKFVDDLKTGSDPYYRVIVSQIQKLVTFYQYQVKNKCKEIIVNK